jgi:hypothetical protein
MKNIRIIAIAIVSAFLFSCDAKAGTTVQFPFAGRTVILLDSAGAAAENVKSDVYTRALTPFDLQIRLGIPQGATEKDYLARSASQVRDWPVEEQAQLKQAFGEVDAFLKKQGIKLNLPSTIMMIKTAGKEEFEADGYTRGNRIMLCTNPRQPISTHTIAHELFHVYSRFNEQKRNEIYAIFGFKKCDRMNTAQAIGGRMITNPDCPFIEHYITVKVNEKPVDMVLQLYSKNDYDEKYNLGDYANVGLLQVAGNGTKKMPVIKDGKGVFYELDQVPDLFAHISTNTSYVLHPEEISAEHFAMWVIGQKVPQPEFMEKLAAKLK